MPPQGPEHTVVPEPVEIVDEAVQDAPEPPAVPLNRV